MKLKQFDTISWIILAFTVGFSVGVSTSWDWFPEPGDWGQIAYIKPHIFSYLALTLPWVLILAYSILRRRIFKDVK